jgi:hypothetical protein
MCSQWPAGAESSLRAHVAECAVCQDLVVVVRAVTDDHHAAVQDAPVPSSAQVWWRAQLRARQEATRAASRPLTVVHGLAATVGIILVVVLGAATMSTVRGWLPYLADLLAAARMLAAVLPGAATLLSPLGLMAISVVMLSIIAAPFALYFASTDE